MGRKTKCLPFSLKVAWAQMTHAAWMPVIMALNRILIALDYFPEQLIIYCACRPPPAPVTL